MRPNALLYWQVDYSISSDGSGGVYIDAAHAPGVSLPWTVALPAGPINTSCSLSGVHSYVSNLYFQWGVA